MIRSLLALLILASVSAMTGCSGKPSPEVLDEFVVGIQVLGEIDDAKVDTVRSAIERAYGFRVIRLTDRRLPQSAFVQIKSSRYRADTLIRFLRRIKPDSINVILGITERDISTTKRDANGEVKKPATRYLDFGIFGLGFRPGPSCVLSTYRLGNSRKSDRRLKKIALHEVGHNLGLKHCKDKNCLMTDAAESIKTIDNAKEELCESCRRQI